MEIIKLGILYFSLFTWYQSQERKPNFFLVIVFHSDLVLRHRSSFTPPQPPQPPPSAAVTAAGDFREALLRPKTTAFEAQRADLLAGGHPAGNRPHTRRHERIFSVSLPSTRRRVSAREGAWLLLRRRASTVRIVRRRLGVLALRRSIPSTPSPPFDLFASAVLFRQ